MNSKRPQRSHRKGLQRAAELLGMSVDEIRNRATITGAIEIGRHPGVVQITFLAATDSLRQCGLLEIAQTQFRTFED